jgi:hypothetical protein
LRQKGKYGEIDTSWPIRQNSSNFSGGQQDRAFSAHRPALPSAISALI